MVNFIHLIKSINKTQYFIISINGLLVVFWSNSWSDHDLKYANTNKKC